jgi:hypothetical protein
MTILHDNICLIGLPVGAYNASLSFTRRELIYAMPLPGQELGTLKSITLPEGNWKEVGIDSEEQPLSEEQCREVVRMGTAGNTKIGRDIGEDETWVFKDYNSVYAEQPMTAYFASARESFASLKEHLKVYTRNPFGEKEPKSGYSEHYDVETDGLNKSLSKEWLDWKEAQQRTFKMWAVIKRQ